MKINKKINKKEMSEVFSLTGEEWKNGLTLDEIVFHFIREVT